MKQEDILEQINDVEREILLLPTGSVAVKNIKGKDYYYHRVQQNGKRKETYVPHEQVDDLKKQIEKRKKLELKLKDLRLSLPAEAVCEDGPTYNAETYRTYVRIGDTLKRYAEPAKKFNRRDCFCNIKDYIFDNETEKVLILYGLRRTGKTTLIRQIIADFDKNILNRTAFMQINTSNTLADVNADLKKFENAGFRYIFIDEVTLLKDFIEGAALFSDIFAASGMKIVLSGTDSLGFLFSEDEQLFDRAVMIHTTFISYREFAHVMGTATIDEYIRYGGTMCPEGNNYNGSVFATAKKTTEYVDSSVAKNIQHSLEHYHNGDHFRNLRELYDKNELTSAINRVVEDINHRFAIETLTRTFESNDLAISARNLRRDRNHPADVLDRIDVDSVTDKLKKSLEILNPEEQNVQIHESHVAEIKEYLKLLDIIEEIDVKSIPNAGKSEKINVITQPGLRYVQAEALITEIIADPVFDELDLVARTAVLERIRGEIKGRMLEELILLETKLAKPHCNVFKLKFAIGEFDMVIADPSTLTCKIFEIKHSSEVVPEQYRHLINPQKCAEAEHFFGKIIDKCVIYRGSAAEINGIKYLNAEEYLMGLQ